MTNIYILTYLQQEITKQSLYFQSHLESQSCKVAVSSPKASWPRLQNFSAAFFLPPILFSKLYITEALVQYISLVTWVGLCRYQCHLIEVVEEKATFYGSVNGVQIDFSDHKPWSSGSVVSPTPGPNPRSSNLNPDVLILDPDPTVLLAWLWDATRGSGRLSSC